MLLTLYIGTVVTAGLLLRMLKRPAPLALLVCSAALPLLLLPEAAFRGRYTVATDTTAGAPPFASEADGRVWNPVLMDSAIQFLPWDTVVRDCLRAGRPPLWNRYQGAGAPLLANGASAPFSPFSLAGLALAPPAAETLATFLKIFLAALGAGVLALATGCGLSAALLAALSYGASNFVVVWGLHPQAGVAALAPWILAGVVETAAGRPLATARLAFAVAGAALAGFVQLFVLSLLAAAILAAALAAADRGRRTWIGRVLLGVALGGMLASPALLPFLRLTRLSAELPLRQEWATERPSPAPAESVRRLFTFVLPDIQGRPQDGTWRGTANYTERSSSSTGATALVLALAALFGSFGKPRRLVIRALAATALAGLVVSSGLGRIDLLVRSVPFLREGDPARFQLLTALAVPVLAAHGLESLRAARRRVLVASAVVLALAVGAFAASDAATRRTARGALARELAPAALVAGAAAAPAGPWAAGIVLVSAIVERVGTVGSYLPRLDASRIYPCGGACRYLKAHAEDGRVAGLGWTFLPNQAAALGLEDVRAYENLTWLPLWETTQLWRQRAFPGATFVDDPTRPFLRFLGLKRIVTASDVPVPRGWFVVYAGPDGRILETASSLPRFFVPGRVLPVPAAAQLHHAARIEDFAATAVAAVPNGLFPAAATIVEEGRSPDSYRMSVEAPAPTFVVSSQPAYPGWRVLVDGKARDVVVVNGAFVGFALGAGRHHVELRFRDTDFLTGCALALLGLAVLAGISHRERRSVRSA